jgi:aminoglycoside phosphotransferase (APT) family kinase protein
MTSRPRELAAQAVRAPAPELRDLEILELGHGLDSVAYAVGDLVVRVGRDGRAGREARLLEAVGARVSIPVPVPQFADEDRHVLAYARIAGRPLLGRSPPAGSARRLGRFLRELHAIDPATVADLIPTEDADSVPSTSSSSTGRSPASSTGPTPPSPTRRWTSRGSIATSGRGSWKSCR